MPLGFGRARSRRRGLVVGAAIGSSRAKRAAATQPAPQAQPVAPTPVETNDVDVVEALKQFAELRDKGILTEEEFAAKKKQLLGL